MRLALWARAVRDSYVALLPLTFLGVLATLAQHLPVPGLQRSVSQLAGPAAAQALGHLLDASQGVFGLALAVAVSLQWGRRLPQAPTAFWLAMGSLVNFMLCVLADGRDLNGALGQGSMLLGLLVGSYTPWLLTQLQRWPVLRLLRVPYETDLVFLQATRMTLPLIVSALLTLVVARVTLVAADAVLPWIAGRLPQPQQLLHGGFWQTGAVAMVNQSLWALGIHGGKVIDVWMPALFTPPGMPFDPARVWRPLIDNFVHLGGSGATLGLVAALLWSVREGPQRRLAQVSLLPSVFNVNELLVFGLPVVLHPRYLLPFIAMPVGLALVGWLLVAEGWMPVQAQSVHWTTPVLLSGWLLTGSWTGVAWQALAVGISTACYLPVVRRVEAQRLTLQRQALQATSQAILDARHQHRLALQRSDQVGEIARGLLADLQADIGTAAVHLAYQPKHRADGMAVGVEALVRWSHRRFGPVRADVAVTLAEDGGLVRPLGLWVLDQACACKAGWNRQGLADIGMAVNVSPLQLDDPQFAADVIDTLRRHGLRGDEVELEITESHALPLGPVLQANMAALSRHGVRLAMDDFGMGHSSLLHLRHFRVHAIKVDGSISREVPGSDASADIVRSIAALGRSQQLEVVAEFVETVEQRDALAALGCTLFQGYLHSPPMPDLLCCDYLLRQRGAATARPDPR